jgi:WD40 repeat protein
VASVSHWQEEMAVWSVDTKDPIWASRAFGAPPSKVAFSPDGHRLLVSAEGSLQCLDFSNRRLLWEQAVHTEPIHAIAVSADGTAALTASRDHTVRRWSMESGASEIAADHGVSVAGTAFVDASTFISIDDHGRVELWNNDNSAHLRTVQCDASQIDDASFAADGGLIAVVSEGRIRVSSLRQPRHGAYMSVPGESATALAIAPDGRVALIGSSEGSLSLVDLATGKSLHKSPPTQSRVQAIVFAVDGSRAMCAWADRQIRVFEVPEMRVAQRASHPDEDVDSVAISDDGDVAASQSQGRVVLWELKSGRELHRWGNLRTTLVPGVRFDGRGDRVITASRRGYANILSRPGARGVAPETLASQLGLNRLSTVGELGPTDFFGDGRRAVSHTVAGSGIVVWGLDNPEQQLRFEHPAQVRSLRLSADEKCLITGADDGGLRLWDTLDGREVLQWMAHDAPVTAVAASPDASLVLSAAQDGTLRLWDFEWPSRIRELSHKPNGESRSQAELVNWYALLGQWAWARELVEGSSAAGETFNALTLARVYWLSGETDRALAHFRQARQRHEAPDYYLDACMRAASDEAVPIRSE